MRTASRIGQPAGLITEVYERPRRRANYHANFSRLPSRSPSAFTGSDDFIQPSKVLVSYFIAVTRSPRESLGAFKAGLRISS